jgi:hypothetical protein
LLRATVYTSAAIDALGLVDHIGSTSLNRNRINRADRLTDTTLVAEMYLKETLRKTGYDPYASGLVRVDPEVLS